MKPLEQTHYDIPPTRLPFVNSEIAKVQVNGQPYMVTAIYGGNFGGKLYFFNPDTKHVFHRDLPQGVPGAYMLRTANDGRLYLGGGNGDLLRYDPTIDTFETLVTGELHNLIWGGCVTDQIVVASGTPGNVVIYDHVNDKHLKTIAPLDTQTPMAHYGHNVLPTPDGKVLISMNSPCASLCVIDPATMTHQSFRPDYLKPDKTCYVMTFTDDNTLLCSIDGHGAMLLAYPSFEKIADLGSAPNNDGRHADHNWLGDDYYMADWHTGHFNRLDLAQRKWEHAGDGVPQRGYGSAAWDENRLAIVDVSGYVHFWDRRSNQVSALDLKPYGHLGPHAFCQAESLGCVVGAPFINARFWSVNLDTGQGADIGVGQPGGGQINQILVDPVIDRVLLVSYTQTAVMAYDPKSPYDFGKNPELIASAKAHGQMRPNASKHDGRHLWIASNAEYGKHNGALSRVDTKNKTIDCWPNIVADMNVTSLAIDVKNRTVYFGTNIHPDCKSADPIAKTAVIGVFDMDTLSLRCTRVVDAACDSLSAVAVLPDGDVLVGAPDGLYRWSPASDRMVKLQPEVPQLAALVIDGQGTMWVTSAGRIGVLEVVGDQARVTLLHGEHVRFIDISETQLWYITNDQMTSVPLHELRELLPLPLGE